MYWDTLGARRLPLKPAIFPIMVSDRERITKPTSMGEYRVQELGGSRGGGNGRWQNPRRTSNWKIVLRLFVCNNEGLNEWQKKTFLGGMKESL